MNPDSQSIGRTANALEQLTASSHAAAKVKLVTT